MAVREFDGIDDVIEAAVGGLPSGAGALTVLCLWKPLAVEAGCLMRALDTASGTTEMAINPYSDGNVYFSSGTFSSMPYTAADGWLITGFGKGAGSAAATGHKYVFATDTWTHPGLGTLSGSATVADLVRFGLFSGIEYGNMRLAAVAVWAANLSTPTVESLDRALSDWLAAGPAVLWPFTQASVTDPVEDATGGGADQTARTGTTVVTGDHPPGFNLLLASDLTLTGTVPALTGTITVDGDDDIQLVGNLPAVTAALTVAALSDIVLAAALPVILGHFTDGSEIVPGRGPRETARTPLGRDIQRTPPRTTQRTPLGRSLP